MLALRYARLIGDAAPLSFWEYAAETPAWVVDGIMVVRRVDAELAEQRRKQDAAKAEAERLARGEG